ncbi:MAG: hypothetical protein C0467_28935, partial [Planctomycetaceae bacterium]|nr:hypothetical protein [Planctomycetaceae bacterium]
MALHSGDFVCSKLRGQSAAHLKVVTRDDFTLEPCHKCIEAAEAFDIELGPLWEHIPGPRVKLYTTSPEYRDRPYAKRGKKPVGYYHSREVYCVEVPEDLFEITRQWYQRDLWHSWTPEMWAALLE